MKTAVQFLANKISDILMFVEPSKVKEIVRAMDEAKQIEKEQIMNARLSTFDLIRRDDVLEAEQYYTETYERTTSTE